jgi:hypothetical protein
MKFNHRDLVKYRQHKGFVNYIDEQNAYLTICLHEKLKPEPLRVGSKCDYIQVNLIVYPEFWHLIERQDDEE